MQPDMSIRNSRESDEKQQKSPGRRNKSENSADNPIDYTTGKRLHGKFRAGDIRWENQIRQITRLYLRPGQPPMYQVDDNMKVAYGRGQLQVVSADELRPTNQSQHKFIIEKLLKRFKTKNKVYFQVLWDTNEPRTNLMKDVPELVEQFENSY